MKLKRNEWVDEQPKNERMTKKVKGDDAYDHGTKPYRHQNAHDAQE